jgi:hypothetical protein
MVVQEPPTYRMELPTYWMESPTADCDVQKRLGDALVACRKLQKRRWNVPTGYWNVPTACRNLHKGQRNVPKGRWDGTAVCRNGTAGSWIYPKSHLRHIRKTSKDLSTQCCPVRK